MFSPKFYGKVGAISFKKKYVLDFEKLNCGMCQKSKIDKNFFFSTPKNYDLVFKIKTIIFKKPNP